MSLFEIPLPQTDGQKFTFSASLSGVLYQFSFYFNERTQTWSFGIADSGGSDIALGLACRLNYDLLAFVSDSRTPPGLLMLTDTGGKFVPPGRNDLGARVKLIYDDLINPND